MNTEQQDNNLTIDEWVSRHTIDGILDQLPHTPVERDLGPLGEHCRSLLHATLSDETRRLEELRLARMARKKKALRQRKPYTRKRGHIHPKKKEATRKRKRIRLWAKNPYSCVIHGWGVYKIDKTLWDEYITPLWAQYNPADLSVKRYRTYGTWVKPHTIYTIDVVHSKKGIVYKGQDQEIYDLSKPNYMSDSELK